MNGRIAKSTRLPRRPSPRNSRTLLLAVCCALSVAMLGAVRFGPHLRPDPLLAVSPSMSEPAVAPWHDGHDHDDDHTTGAETAEDAAPALAMNTAEDPVLTTPAGLPAGAELLVARAAPAPAVAFIPGLSPVPPAPRPVVAARTRQMLMEVTAYCPCPRCCGPRAQGITASGRRVSYNGGKFVAADTRLLKFNTKLRIPGYANNLPVEVIDRGGAIKGNKLDVYFPTHQEARKWGRQKLWVTVEE